MFGTVIVPLDGSRHTEAALPFAAEEAARQGAVMLLVRVIVRPAVCPSPRRRRGPALTEPAWPAAEIDLETREAKCYLADTIDRYRLDYSTRTAVLVGDPTTCLLAEAARREQPVIVLSTDDPTGGPKPSLSDVERRLKNIDTVPVIGVRQQSARQTDRLISEVTQANASSAVQPSRPHTGYSIKERFRLARRRTAARSRRGRWSPR